MRVLAQTAELVEGGCEVVDAVVSVAWHFLHVDAVAGAFSSFGTHVMIRI